MRALLQLLSFVLLLPSLVLTSGFLLLGHAIAGGNLLQILLRLLNDVLWLGPTRTRAATPGRT